jgi:hypothetical protein
LQDRTTHPPLDAWASLAPSELGAELFSLPLPWWIGGGWAIDLFVGHQTRPHGDTDIVVLRRHAPVVLSHLVERWRPFSTGRPTPSRLEAWNATHPLSPDTGSNSVWLAHPDRQEWAFEILLMDDAYGRWVFRREPEIGGPIADMGWTTDEGLLVLQPEIQLLYKARRSTARPEDDHDFEAALPHLSPVQRGWLAEAVELHDGPGHPWLPGLRAGV